MVCRSPSPLHRSRAACRSRGGPVVVRWLDGAAAAEALRGAGGQELHEAAIPLCQEKGEDEDGLY